VDFCGIQGRKLYFIEVKDFRDHRIENKDRFKEGSPVFLGREVALKVRDTMAGILAALRSRPDERQRWAPFISALSVSEPPCRVVLWLEQDLPRSPPHSGAAPRQMPLPDQIKRHFEWLKPRVDLASLHLGHKLPGLIVENVHAAADPTPFGPR
jgi:hypothetical protein